MAAILDLCQKNNFACLDFSRLLVCYSRDPSGLKTIEKPSVAICGGSFSILTGLNGINCPVPVIHQIQKMFGLK